MTTSTADRVLDALQPYGLKESPPGSGKYRCNSPLSPGSNSHSFSVTIKGPEEGEFNDFNPAHADHGNLYKLADHLGIDHPGQDRAINTKRVIKDLDEYARDHGLTGNYLRSRGWVDATYQADGVKHRAIRFDTPGGRRWRLLDVDKNAYRSPGCKESWYGLAEARLIEGALNLVNGEISTEAALFYGIPAFCKTMGEKAIPARLMPILKASVGFDRPINICYDCDEPGRAAASAVYDQLVNAGYEHVRNLDLGLTKGGDFADLCRLYTDKVKDRLLELKDIPSAKSESAGDPKPDPKKAKPDNQTVAELVNVLYGNEYRYDHLRDTWYAWANTHWREIYGKPVELRKQIRDAIKEVGLTITDRRISDVRELFGLYPLHSFDSDWSNGLINFRNGTLNLATMKLRKADRADHLTSCIDYDFMIGASAEDCPTIARVISENIPDNAAIKAYMTHLGAALCHDLEFHQTIILKGGTHTGKTTLLLLAMLITGNTRGMADGKLLLSPDLEGMRSRASWHSETLVPMDEFPEGAIREDGGEDIFKKLTAHSYVSMRQMFALEIRDNRWLPKLIFATNNVPRWRDPSGAMARRIRIVECPNVREDQGLQREKEMMAAFHREAGAFAALCLKEWRETLDLGKYPESEEMRDLLINIERSGDSVKLWQFERLRYEASGFVTTKALYEDYQGFCMESGLKPVSRPKLMDVLSMTLPMCQRVKQRTLVEGSTKPMWGLDHLVIDPDHELMSRSTVPSININGTGNGTGDHTDEQTENNLPRSTVPSTFLKSSLWNSEGPYKGENSQIKIEANYRAENGLSKNDGTVEQPPLNSEAERLKKPFHQAFHRQSSMEQWNSLSKEDRRAFHQWRCDKFGGPCPLSDRIVHDCLYVPLTFDDWWKTVKGADQEWIERIEDMKDE